MAKDTAERILDAALEMFSLNGYAGGNLRELGERLGLAKSALYRHFTGKEALLDALLDRMEAYYDQRFGSVEHLPPVPDSCEALIDLTMRMIGFTIRDKQIIMIRRLLLTEQFRNDRLKAIATRHFLTGLQDMFASLFAGMMEKGILRKDDPAMLAFAYTTPISALVQLSDREPEKQEEILGRIRAFSEHFTMTYETPESRMASRMIAWAAARLDSGDYAGRCLSFIEDALEKSNNIEIFGGGSAKESCMLYRDALRTGQPERGAFVFYDCLCPSEEGLRDWGHCGIALRGGRVIHAWDKVRIDGYKEIESLTTSAGDHPAYIGWVPLSRVLAQPSDR